MQGFLTNRKSKESEWFIYIGNILKAKVKVIGTYSQHLETNYQMDLMDIFYIPSISRNLVSLTKLDVAGHCYSSDCGKINLYFNLVFISSDILCDGVLKLY